MPVFDNSPLTLAGVGLATTVAYFIGKRYVQGSSSDVWRLQKPTGGNWIWGYEGEVFLSNERLYTDNEELLGGAYAIKGALFHPDILILTDTAAISHIFTKRAYNYVKGDAIRALVQRVIGRGLTWADGDEHKQHRALVSPCFAPAKVKAMEGNIRIAAERLASSIQSHIMENSSGKSARIDLVHWVPRATLDVIGTIGFGHDFQCGASPEAKEIVATWNSMVSGGLGWAGFVGAVVVRAFPFLASLPAEGMKKQEQVRHIVRRIGREIVEERVRNQDHTDRDDLLSILVRARPDVDDFDQLLDQMSTLVMSGYETTSTAIHFAIHELAKNKAAQDRLRQEVMEFVGSGLGGEPTYDEYQSKLPFLDGVCKEALRLYPSASRLERSALQDDIVPLKKPVKTASGETLHSIKVTKGQTIVCPVITVNRSKSVWGPNGHEFVPERWLSSKTIPPSEDLTQGWSGILTYSEGPRMCVGHRLATFEIKIILSTLIKNFEFSHPGMNITSKWSLTLQPLIAGKESEGVQLPVDVKLIV